MINKVSTSTEAALQGIFKYAQTIAVDGFGLCGIPEALIEALKQSEVSISNHAAVDDYSLDLLL
jgi:3-oxoacid CoA-transferase subunit A